MRTRVTFEAEIHLVDDELPTNPEDEAAIRQAVQNEIGHTGAVVLEILDCSEVGS